MSTLVIRRKNVYVTRLSEKVQKGVKENQKAVKKSENVGRCKMKQNLISSITFLKFILSIKITKNLKIKNKYENLSLKIWKN